MTFLHLLFVAWLVALAVVCSWCDYIYHWFSGFCCSLLKFRAWEDLNKLFAHSVKAQKFGMRFLSRWMSMFGISNRVGSKRAFKKHFVVKVASLAEEGGENAMSLLRLGECHHCVFITTGKNFFLARAQCAKI